MSSTRKAIDLLSQVLKDNILLYDVYLHMSSHIGIRKVLSSTMDKTKELIRTLERLQLEPTPLEQRFDEEKLLCIDGRRYENPLSFEGYSSFSDSLKAILQRETLVLELLEHLFNASLNEPDKYSLFSLLEQYQRCMQLLQDRIDLESMLST